MAAVSLFWNTKMAAVTLCENAPYYTDAEILGTAIRTRFYQEITQDFEINMRKYFFLPSGEILEYFSLIKFFVLKNLV